MKISKLIENPPLLSRSLKILKEDIVSTNKLCTNIEIQKETMKVSSQQFGNGVVRATRVPSKQNLAETLTRAIFNPIKVVNSPWYRSRFVQNGEEFAKFVENI